MPKRIKGWKPLTILTKRLKSIDFSKISSFLFPTVNKQNHKPFFWQHPSARIFINILYYLNSHNQKKKAFFSCNYGIILSVCLESFIQIIWIDNSNKFINIMPLSKTFQIKHSNSCFQTHVKRIFFFFNRKEANGMNQCKIAHSDLILTVLL